MDEKAQSTKISSTFDISSSNITQRIGNEYIVFTQGQIPQGKDVFKINMTLCCLCTNGMGQGRINLVPYSISKGSLMLVLTGQVLDIDSCSSDFESTCILMSNDFFASSGLPIDYKTRSEILHNPIINLNEEQFTSINQYISMVSSVLSHEHPYKREIISHLTCAFYYNVGYYIHQILPLSASFSDNIYIRFMEEVQKSFRSERKLAYYAEKLCLTPKYLSLLIYKQSGKTAAQWIDEYTAMEARALLRSTDLTAAQIAEELNFPSHSFFGKFFRRMIGMSPIEYRKRATATTK